MGHVDVSVDNVQQLLSAAKMLDVQHVVSMCTKFIQQQLQPDNALGVLDFAQLIGCQELTHVALNYVNNNFEAIAQRSDEFMLLTADRLMELIASDHIDTGAGGEAVVLSSLMAWIQFQPDARVQYLPTLVQHVRFPRFPQDVLVQIEDQFPILKSDTTCKDLLIEAMKFHLCRGQPLQVLSNPRFRVRAPQNRQKCLLVIGGQAPKAIRDSECFDFQTNTWSELPQPLPTRRCRAGLAVLNNHVYAIGGFNGSMRVKSVDSYNPFTKQWTNCTQMEARRSTLGVAVLNNLIYAVGGFDGSIGLQSAEVFNPHSQQWQFIASMSTRRSSVGVASLNDLLYAVGGYDGASRQCLSSVECYNPLNNTWSLIQDMSQRRSGAGVGVLEGRLYAIGGHDGPAVRKSVECYDPSVNTWTQCADMINARRNAGVVAKDGLLYVVGGDDGHNNLKSVEVFNPKVNSWSLLPHEMQIGRSYAGVAIVDKTWS